MAYAAESRLMIYMTEGVIASFEIGEYWDPRVQIDIVGFRRDNWTDLGECKWGNVSSHLSLSAELAEKVPRYPNVRNATICRRLFVKSFKTKTPRLPSGVQLHTLEDLYAIDDGSGVAV
jgi:Archaea bacterial proteins of unknown function